jgi:hypothetical protein
MKHTGWLAVAVLQPLFVSIPIDAQTYAGPIAKPTSGYGSDGAHRLDSISFTNPDWSAHNIVIYHPADISTPVPTVFYNHALGHGSSEQVTRPTGMKNLVETMDPAALYPESKYQFPCSDTANPRIAFCSSATVINPARETSEGVRVRPSAWISPGSRSVVIRLAGAVRAHAPVVHVYDVHGRVVMETKATSSEFGHDLVWNAGLIPGGTYVIRLDDCGASLWSARLTLSK